MRRYLVSVLALLAVIGSGVVHGFWTGRWDGPEKAAAAQARLRRLPLQLGDWQGEDVAPNQRDAARGLGYLDRRYVNRRTGAAVTVILASGRPGPLAIHTPDVCYVGAGYEPPPCQVFAPRLAASVPRAEIKTAHFIKTKAGGQTHLRVWWSWNAGGTWSAPDNPRMTFAHFPVLYKLHMVREMTAATERLEEDPGLDLLSLLLVEFHKSVVAKS